MHRPRSPHGSEAAPIDQRRAGRSHRGISKPAAAVPVRLLNLTLQGVERYADLPTRRTLIRWVRAALHADAELTLRFVDRREGRRLSHDFRGRDYATNVLTFDYQRVPRVVADIVICVPVVRAEAQSQGKTLRAHLAHLVIHGTLHAQGKHAVEFFTQTKVVVERWLGSWERKF